MLMRARGVVGPRVDTSEESRPIPRRLSQATCTRWSTYSVMLMRTTLAAGIPKAAAVTGFVSGQLFDAP
jgi:hypothetical protein